MVELVDGPVESGRTASEACLAVCLADNAFGAPPFDVIGKRLRPVFDAAAADLRKAIVSAALGKRLPRWGRRRVGPFVVETVDYGRRWAIERRNGRLYVVSGQGSVRVEGLGALPLLAHLSGASLGTLCAVSLRLLGLGIDVDGLRQIQAFIDSQLQLAREGERG